MKKVINIIIVILLISLILISSYNLFKGLMKNKEQDKVYEEIVEIVEPKRDDNKDKKNLEQLYDINNDFIGWLEIEETTINYPIMQSKDKPNFYLDRDFYKNKSQYEAYRQYYENLYNIIKKFKNYSVLGHLDLVKRYGDLNNIIDDKIFGDEIDEILKMAIYDGKGIEINTSCFRYNMPDLTPSSYILKRYKELGGEILTTGSDSHNPSQVAYGFEKVYPQLQDMGYKYICTFDKMKPNFIKL